MQVDKILSADRIITQCNAVTPGVGIGIDNHLGGIANPIDVEGIVLAGQLIEVPVFRGAPE